MTEETEPSARAPLTAPQPADADAVGTTNTWPMWLIAVLPVLDPLVGLAAGALQPGRSPGTTPGGLPITVNLGLLAVALLLAAADRRILLRRGVVRPLHWGWAVLETVYVIARSVVVRRRVGGSLAPLWAWIAANLVGIAVGFIPR